MEVIELEVIKFIDSGLKFIDSGFIREEKHPDWLVKFVHVTKKNGKIQFYIDFCDLNEACAKDGFPLQIIDVVIDNTCGFERMSFMYGFLGYS